jgi:predicted ABC-type exoprotein transport system permease subunit
LQQSRLLFYLIVSRKPNKIYALAYLLIVVSIWGVIMTADWISQEKPESCVRTIQRDRALVAIQTIVLVVGIVLPYFATVIQQDSLGYKIY